MNRLNQWLRKLSPGIITAAMVFGPSKITITSKLGAEYGCSLLWIVAVALFFMMVFTSMSASIGIASDRSLLTIIREDWGKWAGVAIGVGIFLVAPSFQAGNAIGVGIALGVLTQQGPYLDPEEKLSPGRAQDINRVLKAYPHLWDQPA